LQAVEELGQKNWELVASRVGKHAPGACKKQWCKLMKKKADQEANGAHPEAVVEPRERHEPHEWTDEENQELIRLREVEKKPWKEIAETLSRSERTCQNHLSKFNQKGKEKREVHNPWTVEEDDLLLQAVNLLLQTVKELGRKDWEIVATYFPKRTLRSCKRHYRKLIKKANGAPPSADPNQTEDSEQIEQNPALSLDSDSQSIDSLLPPPPVPHSTNAHKLPWTAEEDVKLLQAVKENGQKWKKIAKLFPKRTPETCKKRYKELMKKGNGAYPNAFVEPRPHNKWTDEENTTLLQAVEELGQNNWEIVASRVGKHAPGACRLQWCKLMKKKADQEANATPPSADPNPTEDSAQMEQNPFPLPALGDNFQTFLGFPDDRPPSFDDFEPTAPFELSIFNDLNADLLSPFSDLKNEYDPFFFEKSPEKLFP
jgi:DNA-binding Lrp family transcriptional regulator